jgi:cell division protease FtsH
MKGRSLLVAAILVGAFWLALASGVFQSIGAARSSSLPESPPGVTMTAGELDRLVKSNPQQIKLVVFSNGTDGVTVHLADGSAVRSVTYLKESLDDLQTDLKKANVAYDVVASGDTPPATTPPTDSTGGGAIGSWLSSVHPIFWLIGGSFGLWIFLNWWQRRRQRLGPTPPTQAPGQQNQNRQQGGRGQLDQSFTRSAARKFEPTGTDNKTFKDVAGCDEAIRKLKRVQRWLRSPGVFNFFGAKLPKGVLLVGPPGTGKTLLAKALAGEAGASFYSISGSQFVEVYVGVGAARVRDLFQEARNEVFRTKKPVIIFIDEIDAVGRQRGGGGPGASHDEREQTLNQILVEMDGFAPNAGILVLAATNRADILDAALKRPGRFDYQVLVDLPDAAGREAIYGIHTKGKPMAPNVNVKLLAARTPGFSGADIEASCNEAATLAAERFTNMVLQLRREGKSDEEINTLPKYILMEEFDEAIDVVQMGEARTSRAHAMSRQDMEQTAYHEVGHAAVIQLRNGDPVTKITIVPRARALGYTQALPEGDRFNMTEEMLKTRIMMAMGGRIAQEVFLQTVDTGAQNDFKQAGSIARRMVTEFGMSKLGQIFVEGGDNPYAPSLYGPGLNDEIDREWKRILTECYDEARKLIEANKPRIERVTRVLLEKETILGPEFRELWNAPMDGTETADGAASVVAPDSPPQS